MKILYDHQVFSWQKFGGVSRYFAELMACSKGLFEYDLSGIFSENEYIKNKGKYRPFPLRSSFKGKTRIINVINKYDSKRKIKAGHFSILHPTYYDLYILRLKERKRPYVLTVYDMIHEKFPEYFTGEKDLTRSKKKLMINAEKIIAISHSTKTDIRELYPEIKEDKIVVTHLGTSAKKLNIKAEKTDYILFTGQRGAYKNFDIFVRAVAPLLLKYDLRLVCTGGGLNRRERQSVVDLGIGDRIICKFATENDLQNLYSGALAFVFPSLYEGFGIPVLEAFAAGCPAVLSNTSSLPEVGGNAAVYFDPRSMDEIRTGVEKIVSSPSLRIDLAKRGQERLKEFSWERCALETCKVYEQIV
jgi:glycosyltransferase involved in cell wall biosynthesis